MEVVWLNALIILGFRTKEILITYLALEGVYEDKWISNNLNEGRLYLGNVFKNRKDALKELIRRRYSLNN